MSSIGDLNGDGIPELLIGAPIYPDPINATGATYVVSGAALNSCLSRSPEEVFFVNAVQQDRIIDEINTDGIQLHIRNAENADTQLHRIVRNTEDDSSSVTTEPIWHDLPLNAAQIPFAQVGIHLLKQGYNSIVTWFQGKNNAEQEQATAVKEQLSYEQAAETLNGYNNIFNQLENVIYQLELYISTDNNQLSCLKEALIEYKEQGKQLLNQPEVNHKLLIDYCENIETLAHDLNEFARQQVSDDLALSYIRAELAGINQVLQINTDNTEMLNGLQPQLQTESIPPMLCEDTVNISTNNTEIYTILGDSSLLTEAPLLLG